MTDTKQIAQQQAEPSTIAKWKILARGLAPTLLINAVCPFIIYTILKNYVHTSDFVALIATGIPSLLDSIVGIIRSRRIDFLAGAAIFGIVISLGLILLGGSPKLLLVRESFLTLASGLAFLVSLLLPKPLGFYTARQFLAGRNETRIAWYNRLWTHASFRSIVRIQTVIWGVCLTLEAVIRTYLVFTLSVEQFLVVSPFVLYGLIGLTIVASGFYMRFWKERHQDEALQKEMATSWSPTPAASE